ncbi:MAG: hypothetical protein J6D04_06165 [Clostridia bacterium]|nr:hypothetical protein [Clostridia bacterium]
MKVALLGDSIRLLGYGTKVPELLGDAFEVYQPADNCRYSKYTLRGLFDWKAELEGTDIVHWNNGLWDLSDLLGDGKLFTEEDEYIHTMCRIADILLARYKKVIFATTTPVTEKNPYNKNEDTLRITQKLVPLLEAKGVIINDLYSFVLPHLDTYIDQNDYTHLTPTGIDACAQRVAEYIRTAAKNL